jgi:hypothetical protein
VGLLAEAKLDELLALSERVGQMLTRLRQALESRLGSCHDPRSTIHDPRLPR